MTERKWNTLSKFMVIMVSVARRSAEVLGLQKWTKVQDFIIMKIWWRIPFSLFLRTTNRFGIKLLSSVMILKIKPKPKSQLNILHSLNRTRKTTTIIMIMTAKATLNMCFVSDIYHLAGCPKSICLHIDLPPRLMLEILPVQFNCNYSSDIHLVVIQIWKLGYIQFSVLIWSLGPF